MIEIKYVVNNKKYETQLFAWIKWKTLFQSISFGNFQLFKSLVKMRIDVFHLKAIAFISNTKRHMIALERTHAKQILFSFSSNKISHQMILKLLQRFQSYAVVPFLRNLCAKMAGFRFFAHFSFHKTFFSLTIPCRELSYMLWIMNTLFKCEKGSFQSVYWIDKLENWFSKMLQLIL